MQDSHCKAALDYALLVIEGYENEIENATFNYGIDLVKLGFCQSTLFHDARKVIAELAEHG